MIISHNTFIAVYNTLTFLGDAISRKVAYVYRPVNPLFFNILSVLGAAMCLSKIAVLAWPGIFLIFFANGSICACGATCDADCRDTALTRCVMRPCARCDHHTPRRQPRNEGPLAGGVVVLAVHRRLWLRDWLAAAHPCEGVDWPSRMLDVHTIVRRVRKARCSAVLCCVVKLLLIRASLARPVARVVSIQPHDLYPHPRRVSHTPCYSTRFAAGRRAGGGAASVGGRLTVTVVVVFGGVGFECAWCLYLGFRLGCC